MGFFGNLFKKKEKKQELPMEEEVVSNEPICSFCNMSIAQTQAVKTYNGKKWHLKPCWREVRKMAKNHNL